MKRDQKIISPQILLNGALLIALALSGIVSFFLADAPVIQTDSCSLFTLSLVNCVVLVLLVAFVNFSIKKNRKRTPDDTHHVDQLTGFSTRHAFGEVLEHSMLDAKRTLEPLSAILIDIDHFRMLNEEHGSHIGDEILTMLSQIILSELRASDITCRWEGDQFLIILKDCSPKDSCKVAEKLLVKINEEQLELGRTKIGITVSIGISLMLATDDIESLVARAETGLHSARDSGRNTFAIGYDWILIDYACDPIF